MITYDGGFDAQMSDSYFVWVRSDGHASATQGSLPENWQRPTGEYVTFAQIGTADTWEEAMTIIRDWKLSQGA